jgi:hypothetical protein
MMPGHAERSWARALGNYSVVSRAARDSGEYAAIFAEVLPPTRSETESFRVSEDQHCSDQIG